MNHTIIEQLVPLFEINRIGTTVDTNDLEFKAYCLQNYYEEYQHASNLVNQNMNSIKILFLDFDGVLNSASTMKYGIHLCNKRVVMLSNLCKDLDIKIVISSSWRILYSLKDLREMLHRTGFGGGQRIIDVTNEHNTGHRGKEIKEWLNNHPEVTKYAIIDDDSDMLPEQLPYFVKTSWKTGLNKKAIDKLRLIYE